MEVRIKMMHEKIFKRPCGGRVKVKAHFVHDTFGRLAFGSKGVYHRYDVIVSFCLKGKRTFHRAESAATIDEVEQVKTELWQKLKPY